MKTKTILLNLLLKLLVRHDFVEQMNDLERLRTFLKMKDPQIVKLLKFRYTNSFSAHLVSNNDEERWTFKGRVLELLDLLNAIENVEQSLLDIKQYKKGSKERGRILNPIKSKLINPKIYEKISKK